LATREEGNFLELFEEPGILRTLHLLLDKDRSTYELIKKKHEGGLFSRKRMNRIRMWLVGLKFAEQYKEGKYTYLRLTEKGRIIAEKVKELSQTATEISHK